MAATYAGQPPTNGRQRQCEAALANDTKRGKRGERCPNSPLNGSNICHGHGGSAPQVKEAARMRLARLIDPAIDVIASIIKPDRRRGERTDTIDRALRVRTAENLLNRVGLKEAEQVQVGTYSVDPKDLDDDALRAVIALREQLGQRKQPATTDGGTVPALVKA